MKSENRDINFVELATIPNFSTLDDLITPLRLLELFFVTYISWFDFRLHQVVQSIKQALILILLMKNFTIFKYARVHHKMNCDHKMYCVSKV